MKDNCHVQCHSSVTTLKNVKNCLENGHCVLILMRGLPGSGKSSFARNLATVYDGVVYSTDDFFTNAEGQYVFDHSKLDSYHSQNVTRARDAMREQKKPVIIDNTNLRISYMQPYVNHAVREAYEVYIVEPATPWARKALECANRNSHDVPLDRIKEFLSILKDEVEPTLDNILRKGTNFRLQPPIDFSESLNSTPTIESSCEEALPQPFLSLTVPDCAMVDIACRNVGTQCSDSIIAMESAIGLVDDSSQVELGESLTRQRPIEPVKPNERAIQVGRTLADWNVDKTNSDMNLLFALFPAEDRMELYHQYELCGKCVNEVITFYSEIGTFVDVNAQCEEVSFTPRELSFSTTKKSILQCPLNNDCEKDVSSFGRYQSLSESSQMLSCEVNNAGSDNCLIDVQLSDDMRDKLAIIFGDNKRLVNDSNQLSIPFWLLRMLYQAWQFEDIDIPQISSTSETENDAELARLLHEELNNQDDCANKIVRPMTAVDQYAIKTLCTKYSTVDAEYVKSVFVDCGYDRVIADNTLRLYFPHVDSTTDSSFTTPEANVSLPIRSLCSAQEVAREKHAKAQEIYAKMDEERRKVAAHTGSRNQRCLIASYRIEEARRLKEQADLIRKEANDEIKLANNGMQARNRIDLHLMNVREGLELLKERLQELDRPGAAKNRKRRKLHVITGYGKNSDKSARLKPAIIQFFNNNGYSFTMSNEGEIVVECK